MTDNQKHQILLLRKEGYGYTRIAGELGISQNTVKSYCRRNRLTEREPESTTLHTCLQCGASIKQNEKRKLKKFCSDKCRMQWWNSHRSEVSHTTTYVCANCHTEFKAYGARKYCSHSCYIHARFGGNSNE